MEPHSHYTPVPPAPYTARASGNDDIVRARARLGENLDTEYLFESDLLVISYDHYYPDQAAAGLEFAVQRLRAKMHALTIERVRRRKIFLDERLGEVRQDRTEAQDALTEFQQEFGVINLAAQSESAIQNVTALKTELYRKEVELHSQIELLGENTAAVVRLRSAVDQLRTLIREIEHGFVEFQDSAIPLQELSSFRASTSCCAAPRDGEGPITLPTGSPRPCRYGWSCRSFPA